MEQQNRDQRASIFTVRNAENAMITFSILALFCFFVVFFHEILIKSQSVVDALYSVAGNISKIMSAATGLLIFEETIDIMFQRIRDTLKKEKELKAQAIAEGKAEGIAEGKAEGIAEGKAEGKAEGIAEGKVEGIAEGKAEAYREMAEWNSRRLAAEARGEEFTEPPPGAHLNG